ncbi:hypothetical protein FIBSPDRAFT_945597 [Athelia psychrophila]|uniref:SAP domain-containing protein n=1 Tax=Athelia psychrophila TaxID=1759441 RepID=A0A166TJ00_9AGAM|nr:hypothetical protein FIBSPDRAFT_945597 [Fibularhizoctonia sp. CBS 109695]
MPSGPFTKPVSTCLKADLDRLAIHFDLDGSGNIKTLRKRVKDYVDAHADALASDRVFASLFTARDLARLRPVAPPRDITPPTRSTTRSPTPSSDRVPSTWSGIRGSRAPSEHSSRRGFSQIGAGVEDLVDTMGHQCMSFLAYLMFWLPCLLRPLLFSIFLFPFLSINLYYVYAAFGHFSTYL